jgi:uncharacterized repeat protein (TIGR03803 family)
MAFPTARISFSVFLLATLFVLTLAAAQPALAQTETLLYSFGATSTDGTNSQAALISDKEGNFYGTTSSGGAYGYGAVFELSASGTETILYSFGATSTDGQSPQAGLVMDTKGNLYGTTTYGGVYTQGTVFELSPSTTTGIWTETILWSFGATATDGFMPWAALIRDSKGNLYGVTELGGANGTYPGGTVYKLTPVTKKKKTTWTETILYSFGASATDAYWPTSGLLMDKAGNLYGTTTYGGTYGNGTVFELSASGTETILYSFGASATDAILPWTNLIRDSKGNFYGTTTWGGAYGNGTVFELSASGTETVLYSFGTALTEPFYVNCGLIMYKGNLYGTSQWGGANGGGTVYELSLVKKGTLKGTWAETIPYAFGASATDGTWPEASLIMDKEGNFYGTTFNGGEYSSGTVFKLVP